MASGQGSSVTPTSKAMPSRGLGPSVVAASVGVLVSVDPPPQAASARAATAATARARTVLREMGLDLPGNIRIRVWDTTTDTRYMVLPHQPAHTRGWSLQALEALITKESMIGVARLESPFAGA